MSLNSSVPSQCNNQSCRLHIHTEQQPWKFFTSPFTLPTFHTWLICLFYSIFTAFIYFILIFFSFLTCFMSMNSSALSQCNNQRGWLHIHTEQQPWKFFTSPQDVPHIYTPHIPCYFHCVCHSTPTLFLFGFIFHFYH